MAGQLQNGAPTSTQVGNYNTYVGARYVPVIYGEWDARVAYEPLTIVTYQGNSYTSKQYVPVGVQITNDTYWVMTGNFNGQVSALEEMVIRNTQSINELYKNERKALIIGNSYAAGTGSTDNKGIYYYLKSQYKDSVLLWSSGIGFSTYTNVSETFGSLLTNYISNPSIPLDEITDIIFISAMGDTRTWQEGATAFENKLRGALSSINALIGASLPSIINVVTIFAETRTQQNFTAPNNEFRALYAVNAWFRKLLPQYNIKYGGWIGWETLMIPGMCSSDNYHPSNLGYSVLGSLAKGAIYNEYYPKHRSEKIQKNNVVIQGDITATVYLWLTYHPDFTIMYINQITNLSGTIQDAPFKPFPLETIIPNLPEGTFASVPLFDATKYNAIFNMAGNAGVITLTPTTLPIEIVNAKSAAILIPPRYPEV